MYTGDLAYDLLYSEGYKERFIKDLWNSLWTIGGPPGPRRVPG